MVVKNYYEYFNRIKERPRMYLGSDDINLLFIHFQGYKLSLIINSLDIIENPPFEYFHDYIAVMLGYSYSTAGWANMLHEYYKDSKVALEKFFEYLEEYKKDMKGKTREEMGEFLRSKGYNLYFNFTDKI